VNKIKFSMAFHCYQPVFNFEGEFENAYKKAYLPLLDMVYKHPGIKASFHYPGNMIKWFIDRHPEYIDKLRELIKREQVEIIGGCYYEPVMAMIPDDDRMEQIKKNNLLILETFGVKPRGAWIAERVWEPELAETLINSEMEYTILDDNHLLKAGAEKKDMFRPWNIREKSGDLVVFPAQKELRYSIPFRSPESVLDYMKKTAQGTGGDTCLFFADDGEKFGAWPHTDKLVYKKGWLDKFFSLLAKNTELVETCTYSEVLDTVKANRIKYLPPSSYSEMMEWSKGDFSNFFRKYPEADRMHKRMINISRMIKEKKVASTGGSEEADIKEAKMELYKAQSGCAYWHGTFGGVYLPHLRAGVYHHLIKAKGIMSRNRESLPTGVRSVEHKLGDNDQETVIENDFMDVFLKTSEGGGISELDYKPKAINLVNSMSRIEEQYHKKIKWRYIHRARKARLAIVQGISADIHDALGVGERGLKKFLYYDDHRRDSFITHILDNEMPFEKLYTGVSGNASFLRGDYDMRIEPEKDSISARFSKSGNVEMKSGRVVDIDIEKKLTIGKGSYLDLTHEIKGKVLSGKDGILKYAIEFNMLVWDEKRMKRSCRKKTDRLLLEDQYSGLKVEFLLDGDSDIGTYPVYTVNETEKGLLKTFQGMAVIVGRELPIIEAGLKDDIGIKIKIG